MTRAKVFKIVKLAGIVLAGLLVVIQVIRPTRDNPAEDPARTLQAMLSPPPAVDAILTRACADCHSNRTSWPWYTNVAPLSWWIADHVHEGRDELSFSNWAAYPPDRQARKLRGMCKVAQKGEMPLGSYLLIHRDARLSKADIQTLCDWTTSEHDRLVGPGDPPRPPR